MHVSQNYELLVAVCSYLGRVIITEYPYGVRNICTPYNLAARQFGLWVRSKQRAVPRLDLLIGAGRPGTVSTLQELQGPVRL